MGQSISAFIEYAANDHYQSFSEDEIWFPRDNRLFVAIAWGPGGDTDAMLYPPRGLPPNLSETAHRFFYSSPEKVKNGGKIS